MKTTMLLLYFYDYIGSGSTVCCPINGISVRGNNPTLRMKSGDVLITRDCGRRSCMLSALTRCPNSPALNGLAFVVGLGGRSKAQRITRFGNMNGSMLAVDLNCGSNGCPMRDRVPICASTSTATDCTVGLHLGKRLALASSR